MNRDIHHLRENYTKGSLDTKDVAKDPIAQFRVWFEQAQAGEVKEPNAMILSTVSADLRPHARTMLLKEVSDNGFVFYTNYNSAKALDIEHSPYVSLTFLWLDMERQVRVEGKVSKISQSRSEKYYHSRPRGSQIGAWVSPQSEIVESREWLENQNKLAQERFADTEVIPLPPHWGGYEIIPDYVEFWQGRPSRLHDRIAYVADGADAWNIHRLAP